MGKGYLDSWYMIDLFEVRIGALSRWVEKYMDFFWTGAMFFRGFKWGKAKYLHVEHQWKLAEDFLIAGSFNQINSRAYKLLNTSLSPGWSIAQISLNWL